MLSQILVLLVALLHLYFMYLEMFMWTKPLGLKAFRLEKQFAEASKNLAMNQGLYNGFLAAGLIWGLIASSESSKSIQLFFLSCVVVAGAFGAITVSKKIFFIQTMPAALAIASLFLF